MPLLCAFWHVPPPQQAVPAHSQPFALLPSQFWKPALQEPRPQTLLAQAAVPFATLGH